MTNYTGQQFFSIFFKVFFGFKAYSNNISTYTTAYRANRAVDSFLVGYDNFHCPKMQLNLS